MNRENRPFLYSEKLTLKLDEPPHANCEMLHSLYKRCSACITNAQNACR